MTTITIELPDDIAQNLEVLAIQHKSSVKQEAEATIVNALASPRVVSEAERLDSVMDQIVSDNAELYRRLA